MSSGHGGISIVGARSAAPRGIIFLFAGVLNDVEGGDILCNCGCNVAGIDPLRNGGIGGIDVSSSDFGAALDP